MLLISNWPRALHWAGFGITCPLTPWIVLHSVQLLLQKKHNPWLWTMPIFSPAYSLNCTPLGPITITKHTIPGFGQCQSSKKSYTFQWKPWLLFVSLFSSWQWCSCLCFTNWIQHFPGKTLHYKSCLMSCWSSIGIYRRINSSNEALRCS